MPPELDFDWLRSMFSLVASVAALASSCYLWIARFNREKPSLAVEQVSPLNGEFVWPQHFAELYQAVSPREDEGLACLWLDAAVINNSILPNAALQIEAKIKLANGRWHPTIVNLREDATVPINIEPQSTARLALQLATRLPYDSSRSSNRDRVEQVSEQLCETRAVKLSIRGVKNTTFETTLFQNEEANAEFRDTAIVQRRAA
jgi:hypothetical protein